MIAVHELRKSYGDLVAVDGVSFEIQPHETFGLLGPNGAGKTTTLHMLVGLLRPDSGEIDIAGAGRPSRPKVRCSLGIAPQALSIYEDFTAAENLAFFSRLYRLRGRRLRDAVEGGLQRAGLTDRRRDRVSTFSGGMKRRLHVACALPHDPQVIMLDEPTIGIDPQARNHLLTDIESLREQGKTILITTHHMEEAERLCDRVAIMDQGRILAMDTVSNLTQQHSGRSLVQVEIEGPLPEFPDLPLSVDGNTITLETSDPLEAVRRLAVGGARISSLSVRRPSLETVFLKLTGRSLRD